ncbi:MAG: aspartate kinase [Phycisphaeraceae bacterium]
MGIKVAKFGGTSLAEAAQIRKVQAIVQSDAERRYVVPSAPGKRHAQDKKITDLLYLCHAHAQQAISFDQVFQIIADRYRQIVADLALKLDLSPHLMLVKERIAATAREGGGPDYAASRGEYLNGLIIAELLGYDFVDAADIIVFDAHGRFDSEATQALTSRRLAQHQRAVVPGFYGAKVDGSIKTFSRGGSDISGAIVARGVAAAVYENWTDVNGLLMADPRIVPDPLPMEVVTYRELRELAYMGATVLHDEAIFPVRKAGIPVNIRNTNEPAHPGTMIVRDADPVTHLGSITGIAGRKEFSVIAIEKAMMNAEVGFGRRLLGVLEDHGISYEHTPSGIDTMSVVVADSQIDGKLEKVLADIRVVCEPDTLEVYPHMALIATVGRGMAHTPGIAARVFAALAEARVNIRMIDQGSSEINIIVGVQNGDFDVAVRAIYAAFVKK